MKHKPTCLDPIQSIVAASYNGGEHAVIEYDDVKGCGDAFLKYLMRYLSGHRGGNSLRGAINRLSEDKDLIDQVLEALKAANTLENAVLDIILAKKIPGDIAPCCDLRTFYRGIRDEYSERFNEEEKEKIEDLIAVFTFPRENDDSVGA
jgi:hypothetical protein